MTGTRDSYYGQPVIKQPVWTWEIPTYFFTGGVAGAGAGLALVSRARGNDELSRRSWAIALAANAASPLLLSSDLGKPLRAPNMFRMFKVTSPMSVGSWNLLLSGGATGVSAANAWLGWFPRLSGLARPAAAVLGLPLSTYTAALIANTAVPVWHEARAMLPSLFASGAALSAGAAAAALTPVEAAAPARRLALGAAVVEVAVKELMQKRLGELGEPYAKGPAHKFGNASRASVGVGAALMAWRGASSRPAAIAAGVLLGAGALAARWSVFKAGFQSAADPKYVVKPQRRAIEQGRRGGAARRESTVEQPDASIGSPATTV